MRKTNACRLSLFSLYGTKCLGVTLDVRQLLIEGAVINIVRYVCVLKGMLLFVMNKFHQMPWYKKQIKNNIWQGILHLRGQ